MKEKMYRCPRCNLTVPFEHTVDILDSNRGIDIRWCEECNPISCDRCGVIIRYRESYDYGGDWLCFACYDDESSREDEDSIHQGHQSTTPLTSPEEKGQEIISFGFELEVEMKHGVNPADLAVNVVGRSNDFFSTKSDGSLDNGIEIVSKPFTEKYFRTWGIKEMTKVFPLITSSCLREPRTTGLHVHIGKNGLSEADIARLAVFFSANQDRLVEFSKRGGETTWARFDVLSKEAGIGFKAMEKYLKESGKTLHWDRYLALNTSPKNTVEFRLFKGYPDINYVLSRLEFCFGIVDFVKKESLAKIPHSRFFRAHVLRNKKRFPSLSTSPDIFLL